MRDQEILAGLGEIAEDSGTIGLTVYGNVGENMQPVLGYTETGQVQGALAWLTGGFTGTEGPQGPEPAGIEIAQLWDSDGALGLNIYGDVGGTLQPVFTSGDMGQGSGALAWLTGNFTGTGNDSTEIAQLWDNDGVLGLIVYGLGGGTLQTLVTYPDLGQRSSALAFLVGDFTGSGATEIAQLWDNNGILGLFVYGVGNGVLATPVANPDMGQGSGALTFLAGYFTGSGTTTQIAQPWDNNGTLEMIVYGNAGSGNLGTVYAAPMNQGSSALAFLTGNFIGSGYTQIAQARNNNGALQLLVYGDIGNGGLSTVFSDDISQVPFALAWVTGDFTGTGNTQILQPWITAFG